MLRQLLKSLPAVLLMLSLSAQGIIIRHDQRDSDYQAPEGRFPQVFWLHERLGNRFCLATLVAAEWALTAAHCLDETPVGVSLSSGKSWDITLGHQHNSIDGVTVHPEFDALTSRNAMGTDLALLHLAQPSGVTPLALYEESSELGADVFIMGWGYTGSGNDEQRHNDHRFRLAVNTVTQSGQWLEFEFDDPSASGVAELEGMPGLGDSGGPALILSADARFLLAGIARGELQSGEARTQGLYGATAIYERVSLHADWIKAVISGQ